MEVTESLTDQAGATHALSTLNHHRGAKHDHKDIVNGKKPQTATYAKPC
jgi:hypothetical protein